MQPLLSSKRKRKNKSADDLLGLACKKLSEPECDSYYQARTWATELEKASNEQQIYAKKAINEILCNAQLGLLGSQNAVSHSPSPTPSPSHSLSSYAPSPQNYGYYTTNPNAYDCAPTAYVGNNIPPAYMYGNHYEHQVSQGPAAGVSRTYQHNRYAMGDSNQTALAPSPVSTTSSSNAD